MNIEVNIMFEILGDNLENAFELLKISAKMTYKGNDYEVWELSKNEFEKLAALTDADWQDDFGWFRYSRCILEGTTLYQYTVNGETMLGYLDSDAIQNLNIGEEPEDMLDESYYTNPSYDNFTNWLSHVFSLSTKKHIACFAISLATENKLSLSEFMKKYQP